MQRYPLRSPRKGGVLGSEAPQPRCFFVTRPVIDMEEKKLPEAPEQIDGQQEDTEEFLLQLQKGDSGAFETLVTRWYPRLYQTALSYCRQPDDATEVVQETFLAAYLKMRSFGGRSSIGSWLMRITVNMSLMKLRDRRRRTRIEVAYAQERLCHPPAPMSNLQRVGSLVELRSAIEQAIYSLPPDYCIVFILRECRSYSTAAVARQLHISPETVKARLHQARELLRKSLSRHLRDQQEGSEPLYGPN